MVAGLYIEINVVCILILAIFIYKLENDTYKKKNQHILTASMILAMLFFAADALWAAIDGGFLKADINFNYVVNVVYFSLSGFASYLWFVYVANVQGSLLAKNKTILGLFSIPCLVLVILTVNSPITRWIFYIDEMNKYHRGNLYFCQVLIVYGYIVLSAIISIISAFKKQNYTYKSIYLSFGLFPIFPLLAIGLQVYLPGYPLTAIGLTVPLLIVFLKLGDSQFLADELTLLYNKNWYYNMHETLREQHANNPSALNNNSYFLILLDIDHLDAINHQYGIQEGNHALRLVAYTLTNQIRKDNGCGFIQPIRYGDDEFLVLVETVRPNSIALLMDSIYKDIKLYREKELIPYNLSVSMAYVPYDWNNPYAQDFVEAADEELFKVKKAKLL